jgi:hypothetical protein
MTAEHYPQVLQASLDDTETPSSIRVDFHEEFGKNYCGMVKLRKTGQELRVYDADALAPDLSLISPSRYLFFWVRCASVVLKGQKILRPVKLHELYSIWDYEGKEECKLHSHKHAMSLLNIRLMSPPGKLIRLVIEHLLQSGIVTDSVSSPCVVTNQAGMSSDVPFSALEEAAEVRAAAACPDDAEVDVSVWAADDETLEQSQARSVLRRFAVKWWIKFKCKQADHWLATLDPTTSKQDHLAVTDCKKRLVHTRYFSWPRGSRIMYWLLPEEWHDDFRDGIKIWQLPNTDLPEGRMQNIPAETREDELKSREKVFRLWFAWFLEKGPVKLIIPRFPVPKATDIRVVWDSKANGHNAVLWAPSFMLNDFGDLEEIVVRWLSVPVGTYLLMGCPSQDYTQDATSFIKSWQVDIDVGKHFNNFQAHEDDRPYLGVRMFETRNDGSFEKQWFARYNRLHFGGRASPYIACQGQSRILEWALRPPWDESSPFRWDKVVLNLPTDDPWDPSLPRVMLLRKDGELAARLVDYVDDIHPSVRGKDVRPATDAAHFLKSRMNSVGNMVSEEKYRRPTTRPGAWKGEIINTAEPLPRKSTSAKKWTRFRAGIAWVLEQSEKVKTVSTAELRRIAGLGVNVTEVYSDARCYLKGFFNAIESFRADRDSNGWRLHQIGDGPLSQIEDTSGLTSQQLDLAMEAAERLEIDDAPTSQTVAEGYPPLTRITDELIKHCEALSQLFDTEEPRTVYIRPSSSNKFRYYVGDASAEGFGGATQFPDGSIRGRRGVWSSDFAAGGSNLREAQNQVNHLLNEIRSGLHDGCALWAATDNGVFSAVFLKGMSQAVHLFNLVVSLKVECRAHEVYLHVFHIAGTRMIATGIDGWSRGDFQSGISLGYDLRLFLPLAKPAFEVAGECLMPWIKGWMGSDFVEPLTPEGWFWDGHQPGVHLWMPPPAAALIALKQVAKARQKRPYDCTHVIIIPRILYWEEWRSRFEKEVDVWFVLHSGEAWPHFAHEPLIVGFSFPMNRSYP